MSFTSSIIKTINQGREVKKTINPKAIEQSKLVISSLTFPVENLPVVISSADVTNKAVYDHYILDTDTGVMQTDGQSLARTVLRVINKDNLFIWPLTFSAFFDSSSTATLSTSTKTISFTSHQTFISKSAYVDVGTTLFSATLNATSTSGTFTYYLSADGGSHWEVCTNGSPLTFANVGTDLRIKIVESAGSTGTINLIKCQYNLL